MPDHPIIPIRTITVTMADNSHSIPSMIRTNGGSSSSASQVTNDSGYVDWCADQMISRRRRRRRYCNIVVFSLSYLTLHGRDDRRWGKLLTQVVGQTETQQKAAVREFVNNDVWDDVKFIVKEEDLDKDGIVHKMMYKVHASVPEQNRENLWGNVRAVINPMLNTKRNNTNNELKRKVMGKWSEGGGALSLKLSQLNENPFLARGPYLILR